MPSLMRCMIGNVQLAWESTHGSTCTTAIAVALSQSVCSNSSSLVSLHRQHHSKLTVWLFLAAASALWLSLLQPNDHAYDVAQTRCFMSAAAHSRSNGTVAHALNIPFWLSPLRQRANLLSGRPTQRCSRAVLHVWSAATAPWLTFRYGQTLCPLSSRRKHAVWLCTHDHACRGARTRL